jgi:hypothetical protein
MQCAAPLPSLTCLQIFARNFPEIVAKFDNLRHFCVYLILFAVIYAKIAMRHQSLTKICKFFPEMSQTGVEGVGS